MSAPLREKEQMAAFHFELVSPERLLFSGNVEAVVVPGAEGEFTVLDNHAPVMSVLKPGIVQIGESANKTSRLFVRGGFADVSDKGLTILAEQALPLAELDAAALDAQLKAAEEDVGLGAVQGGSIHHRHIQHVGIARLVAVPLELPTGATESLFVRFTGGALGRREHRDFEPRVLLQGDNELLTDDAGGANDGCS